jgi:hypothetical protein
MKYYLVGYLAVILAVFICVLYIVPLATIWTLVGFVVAFLLVIGVVLKYLKR